MTKAFAITSLILAAACFTLLVGGWIEAIYRLGFRSAVQVTFQSWLGRIAMAVLTIAGPVFLAIGLNLLRNADRDPPAR
jgi:hypothetical protein